MAEALSRSDTEVPSLFIFNKITPAEAGCKEEPTRSRLRVRVDKVRTSP